MSGSIVPGPSATGIRRGARLRFWLLMAVGTICVRGNIGMPGPGGRRRGPIRCKECPELALEQVNGSYRCKNGHRFYPNRGKGRKKGKDQR